MNEVKMHILFKLEKYIHDVKNKMTELKFDGSVDYITEGIYHAFVHSIPQLESRMDLTDAIESKVPLSSKELRTFNSELEYIVQMLHMGSIFDLESMPMERVMEHFGRFTVLYYLSSNWNNKEKDDLWEIYKKVLDYNDKIIDGWLS